MAGDRKGVQVVILAGGRGTRLGARTRHLPKSLVRVAGRPFVDWQLERLRDGGADEVVLCVGHLGDAMRSHVGDGARFGLRVVYSKDGPGLSGTGGAVRRALSLLWPQFLVTYGDTLVSLAPTTLLAALRRSGAGAMMSVLHRSRTRERPNCAVRAGKVARYSKSETDSEMDYLDYGLIALSRDVVARWLPDSHSLERPFGALARRGALAAYEVTEGNFEIGAPEGLAALERALAPPALRANRAPS